LLRKLSTGSETPVVALYLPAASAPRHPDYPPQLGARRHKGPIGPPGHDSQGSPGTSRSGEDPSLSRKPIPPLHGARADMPIGICCWAGPGERSWTPPRQGRTASAVVPFSSESPRRYFRWFPLAMISDQRDY
jgi:hypothetical protein